MARNRISVEGADELSEKLDALPEQVREGTKQAVSQASKQVASDAESKVPRDTGNVANSIESKTKKDGQEGEVFLQGSDTYYAYFIEYGTSKMSATPFMKPASEKERQRFPDRVRDEVRKALPYE